MEQRQKDKCRNVEHILKSCKQHYMKTISFDKEVAILDKRDSGLSAFFYDTSFDENPYVQYALDTRIIQHHISNLITYTKKYSKPGPHQLSSDMITTIKEYINYQLDNIEHLSVEGQSVLNLDKNSAKNFVIYLFYHFSYICLYLFNNINHYDSRNLLIDMLHIHKLKQLKLKTKEQLISARFFYSLFLYSVIDTYHNKNINDPIYRHLLSLTNKKCIEFLELFTKLLDISQEIIHALDEASKLDSIIPEAPKRKGGRNMSKTSKKHKTKSNKKHRKKSKKSKKYRTKILH